MIFCDGQDFNLKLVCPFFSPEIIDAGGYIVMSHTGGFYSNRCIESCFRLAKRLLLVSWKSTLVIATAKIPTTSCTLIKVGSHLQLVPQSRCLPLCYQFYFVINSLSSL